MMACACLLALTLLLGCRPGDGTDETATTATPASVPAPFTPVSASTPTTLPTATLTAAPVPPVYLPSSTPVQAPATATPVPASTSTPEPAEDWLVFTVDSTGDERDLDLSDGTCRTATDNCTLRAALNEAALARDPVRIEFAIPGDGPHTIALERDLPVIDNLDARVLIDGYSQPGARPNTVPDISNAVIMIQVQGPRAVHERRVVNAFRITSPGNEIRGLSISRVRRAIAIGGPQATDNLIAGNFIGLGVDAYPWYDDIARAEIRGGDNGAYGIWLSHGAARNRIGGTHPADRNVISGNPNDGIAMRGAAVENRIVGNIIGLSPDGQSRVRNWGDGIDLNYGAARNQIGGTAPGERNVISGNRGEGIEISHGSDTTGNVITGNYIGTDATGLAGSERIHANTGYAISLEGDVVGNTVGPGNVLANNDLGGIMIYGRDNTGNIIIGNAIGVSASGTPLPNRGEGIHLRFHASEQIIGPDNTIAYNHGPGILLADSTVSRITITRNVIFNNAEDGIVLATLAANGRMTPPELVVTLAGTVRGRACPGCTVEIFAAPPDPDVDGGLSLATTLTAGADGTFTLPALTPDVEALTATATDRDGNTSGFSETVTLPIAR
jgi:hypothetical protein